jgi:MinD-like ATPase involved in chromosome partitioning or flagellar assembly
MNRTVIDQAEGLRRMFAADAAHMVAMLGDDQDDIAAALAVALCGRGKKVLLLDEALRAGDSHALLSTFVRHDLSSVLRSEKSLQEIAIPTAGVTLLPAGITRSVQNADAARVRLLAAFHALIGMFDVVLIHAASSALNRPSFGFALAAPEVIVLCKGTSEGITAAYTQIKMTAGTPGDRHFRLLFQGTDEVMAKILFRNLAAVCRQHLKLMPDFAGVLPEQRLAAADALEVLAVGMAEWPLPERDDSRFEAFMRRLLTVTGSRRPTTTEH